MQSHIDTKRFPLAGVGALHRLPVRARMVHDAKEWRWSNYCATAGYDRSDASLTTEWILAGVAETKVIAQQRHRNFVEQGKGQPSPWQQLKNRIFLDDDNFVNNMQCQLNPEQSLNDIPKKKKTGSHKTIELFCRAIRIPRRMHGPSVLKRALYTCPSG